MPFHPLFRTLAAGSAVTLGSTVLSCYMAVEIEKAGHRALYKMAPHLYANVQEAHGLTQEQLNAVRVRDPQTTMNELEQSQLTISTRQPQEQLQQQQLQDSVALQVRQEYPALSDRSMIFRSHPTVLRKYKNDECCATTSEEKNFVTTQTPSAIAKITSGTTPLYARDWRATLRQEDVFASALTG